MGDRLSGLRQAMAAAEAEWRAQSAALADDLIAMEDPEERARALAVLVRRLAETGDTLRPEDEARVLRSFRPEAGAADPPDPTEEEMRAEHEREYAAWRADLDARDAAQAREERQARWLRVLVAVPWVVAALLVLDRLLR
jgi:hypothetical protein